MGWIAMLIFIVLLHFYNPDKPRQRNFNGSKKIEKKDKPIDPIAYETLEDYG